MSHGNHPPQQSGMSTGAKVGIGCLGVLMLGGLGMAGCMAVVATTADDALDDAEEAIDEAAGGNGSDNGGDGDDNGEDNGDEEDDGTIVGNGTHLIGDDIPAGTYHTDGPDEDSVMPHCYWARLSGTSGELDDIIANDNLEGSGVVTVEESDVALELSGGCDWELEE
ncbi:hypothetical protein RIF23_14940 [Lipingzhangella sp. LS1_29]|uniref:Uncharacterized protein n=1 Tax=Lipingzhangella rawalii TaxID=2055835 RepID=A0ABU2H8G6_9ACTN|nr:hypothetical protein [Lipingzhangella rawalii]MDS1271589.1 hypothetical protein [Lipingzhangella rawalii]